MRFQYGTQTYLDSCKQPYVTFAGVSVKEEGKPCANTFVSEGDAWRAYWAAFNKYTLDNKAEVIEWRVSPQIRTTEAGEYFVLSRLSIMPLPQVKEEAK